MQKIYRFILFQKATKPKKCRNFYCNVIKTHAYLLFRCLVLLGLPSSEALDHRPLRRRPWSRGHCTVTPSRLFFLKGFFSLLLFCKLALMVQHTLLHTYKTTLPPITTWSPFFFPRKPAAATLWAVLDCTATHH